MTLDLTPAQVLSGVGVLLSLVTVWRMSARRTRDRVEAARAGARLLSLAGRVVLTAGVIVGVQWLVITHRIGNGWVQLAVLGLPALLASYTLIRALTVTTIDMPRTRRRWGGGRR